MNEAGDFPRLRPGVVVAPFSSSARSRTCLLMLPDGRTLEGSARLADLLPLMDGEHSLEQIAARLSSQWRTSVSSVQVQAWADQVLAAHDLIDRDEASPPPAADRARRTSGRRGWQLLSARLLLPITNRLRVLFHPAAALVLLWLLAPCHYLFYAELLSVRPPAAQEAGGWLAGFLTLLGSVLFHELGHLAACRYFGCPHGEVRVGVYLFFPVFYADVTPSWRLDRRQRLIVDLGGVYFQSILLIPLFLIFRITTDPHAAVLFLEVDGLIVFALNPFLRFDGYWVCSDLLGVPNLDSRSRRLLSRLAARLWRRAAPPDCPLLPEMRRPESWGLALYAICRALFLLAVPPLLATHLAGQLPGLPAMVERTLQCAWAEAARGNIGGLLSHLGRLAFFALLVFSLCRLVWRVGTRLTAVCRGFQLDRPARGIAEYREGEDPDLPGLEPGRGRAGSPGP